MRQTIQVELEDKPGALMRVAGILTATGSNIESLLVAPVPFAAGTSCMIIVVEIEPRLRVRVVQQMNRLVNVLAARDITGMCSNSVHQAESGRNNLSLR
jgi:acetolactate synthase I/III small subunit